MMQRPLRKVRLKDRRSVVTLLGALVAVVMPLGPMAGQPLAAQQSDGPGALALREAAPAEWLSYGRDQAETHYSPLDQINSDNIDRLGLAWSWLIPKTGARLETTPLVSDGVMYATGAHSFVFALDARTGEKIWQWDPGIPDERNGGPSVCCGDVNRGLAIYENHVFAGLLDGRLVALNKETGLVEWVQQTTPPGQDYSITGAPRIAAGNGTIGNGGAEYGRRGYVTAYDTETGRQAWRTYTVPGNPADGFESEAMRVAAETWFGEWWVVGGGGSAWDTFAFDPEANLVYVGTGNGAPWSRDIRSPGGGDNLYLSSILALNADDGELVWYYQTTPGDDWDYTATQPMTWLGLTVDGRWVERSVQAPENGFSASIDCSPSGLTAGGASAWASNGVGGGGKPAPPTYQVVVSPTASTVSQPPPANVSSQNQASPTGTMTVLFASTGGVDSGSKRSQSVAVVAASAAAIKSSAAYTSRIATVPPVFLRRWAQTTARAVRLSSYRFCSPTDTVVYCGCSSPEELALCTVVT